MKTTEGRKIMDHKIVWLILAGAAIIATVAATAEAKPTPAPATYVLGQEIVQETVTASPEGEPYIDETYQEVQDYRWAKDELTASCPAGKVVTGGGPSGWPNSPTSWTAGEIAPSTAPERAGLTAVSVGTPAPLPKTIYAVCVNA